MSDTKQRREARRKEESAGKRRPAGKWGHRRPSREGHIFSAGRAPAEEKEFRRLPEGFDPSFGIMDTREAGKKAEDGERRPLKRTPQKPKPFDRSKTRRVTIMETARRRRSLPRPAPRSDGIPTHEFIIQMGTLVMSPLYGEGTITAIAGHVLTVAFEDVTKTYTIPDAIFDGSLEII